MPKNNSRLQVDQVNAGNFKVPKGEEHLYHVKIEVPQYDSSTGQKISSPRIQKFGAKSFKTMLNTELKKIGYKLEILYDPTEFIKQRKAEKKLSREERIRNKVMAELREAGIIRDENQKTEEQIREEIIADLKAKGLLKEEKPGKGGKSGKDNNEGANNAGSQEPVEETLE